MASNNSLLRSIEVCQNFLKNIPLTGVGGNPLEPAASIGDYTRNFMLCPPFAWRWNRATTTFNTVEGTQDYSANLPNFGWLEKASTNDNLGLTGSIVELENKLNMSEDKSQDRPRYIGARLDDDAGSITFRLLPAPDAVYTVTISYQLASPSFTNLSDTWSPIPDYLSNIYNMGFRAFAYEYFEDPRYAFAFQMFLRQLVASNEGLTDTQRSIYLSEFLNMAREQASVGVKTQLNQQSIRGY